MPDFYGVRVTEKKTSVTAPITAQTATMAFGTAPAHQTGGKANEIVLAYTYAEAVEALGWSDDWEKYTLCEVIYSHFKLYGVAPLLLVNVLDANAHKGERVTKSIALADGQMKITGDAIPATITVTNGKTGEELVTYVSGTDYDVFFEDGACIIEVLPGGALASEAAASVSWQPVSFAAADMTNAVIGGYSVATGETTGIELADQAFFRTKILPDLLIAPGFSQLSAVAAVLSAKAKTLSVVFRSFALCDLDTASATGYQAAAAAKAGSGSFRNVKERMCWPMLKLDGKKFHLSTSLAGLMSYLSAADGGIPSEPASNKNLQADGAILADGTEVALGLTEANFLRGQGITTALNFINGFTAWGEYCACAPGDSDPKDLYCNVARMVNYIANTVVLTFWNRIDEKMTPRLAASVTDMVNIWLNGLASSEHLLGGRCELLAEENPTADLLAGIVRPHIYIGVPGPVQQIDFIVEYDTAYVQNILG